MNIDTSFDRWDKHIKAIQSQAEEQFNHLTKQQLNWKPSQDVWSIAQNLDHLITVNRSYFPVIDQMLEGNYRLPLHSKLSFITNFFGNFIYKSVDPKNTKKISTFSIWEPTESELDITIVPRFIDHQERLNTKIKESKYLLDQHAIVGSPANRYIVYPLSRAFDIIIAHEQRHLNQAANVWSLYSEKTDNSVIN